MIYSRPAGARLVGAMNKNSTVTTQLVADQPMVCLITNRSEVGAGLQGALLQKPINLELINSETSVDSMETSKILEAAYKIVWSVDVGWWLAISQEQLNLLFSSLSDHQSKLTIVLPVNSGFRETVPGEFPYWQLLQQLQAEMIVQLASQLPNGIFVFGFDLVGSLRTDSDALSHRYSTLLLMCQQIQDGVVYAPQMRIYPQSVAQFSAKVTHYALSPNRRSVAIRGSSSVGVKLAQQIKQLYQSYHFSPLDLQVVDGLEQDAVMFSVADDFVTPEPELVERFVSSLPSPSGKKNWLSLDLLETKLVPDYSQYSPTSSAVTPTSPTNSSSSGPLGSTSLNTPVDPLSQSTHSGETESSGSLVTRDNQENLDQESFNQESFSTIQPHQPTAQPLGEEGTACAESSKLASTNNWLGREAALGEILEEPLARSRLGRKTTGLLGKPAQDRNLGGQHNPSDKPKPHQVSSDTTEDEAANRSGGQDFNLNSELQRIFAASHRVSTKSKSAVVKQKKIHISKKSSRRTAAFYGGLVFTGVGLGALCLAAFFLISVRMLRHNLNTGLAAYADLESSQVNRASAGNPEDSNQPSLSDQELAKQDLKTKRDSTATQDLETEETLKSLQRLSTVVALQANSYQKIFSLPQVDEAFKLSKAGSNLVAAHQQLTKTDQLSQKLVNQVLGLSDGEIETTTEDLASQSLLAYEKVAELSASLSELSLAADTALLSDESSLERIKKLENGLRVMQQLQPLLPTLLGSDQPRTYAIVFQNNQELRPTGGYIEAIGVFTFAEGSLIKRDFYNGLQIDNLLPGSVQAPEEIRQFLGEKVWSVRDANWDPSFPKAAEQISWFLEKSLNQDIDGVMTVDIEGLANLLQAIGPVDVPEYNEVLTNKNLAEYIEFHSEVANEVVVKDYRQLIFEKVWAEIFQITPEKTPRLLSALQKNFDQQHSLISFRRSEELVAMTNLSWSGALLKPGCPSQFFAAICQVESIAQVEANVGINRANYYLKRAVEHSVELTDASALHTRQVTFENTAQSESWPKGPYKAYVRFYLPETATTSAVRVSNQPADDKLVRRYQEHGRQVVGIYLEVPVKSSKTLSIAFSTPLQPADELAYVFFEQFQPGSGEPTYTLTMKPAPSQRVHLVAPQAEITDDKVVFTHRSLDHGFFGIQVAREK